MAGILSWRALLRVDLVTYSSFLNKSDDMAIPIPARPSGFRLGDQDASTTLDVFFDIQCPHSRRFWPTLLALIERYQRSSLCVTAHLITVSNHRQAWDVSLGLFAVAKNDSQRFFDFVTFLFERQSQFMNSEFRHKTHEDLRQLVAGFAHDFAGVERESLLTGMDANSTYISARTPIRYAATRSVWATPTIFINNADDVPVAFDSAVEQWSEVLDGLVDSR